MTVSNRRSPRSDGLDNRERLVRAAIEVFGRRGAAAPLEHIARHAGVSRTTLHRHFPTREDLLATVIEDNVRHIEEFAQQVIDADDGVVRLFHFVLTMQLDNPALAHAISPPDVPRLLKLSERTASAFRPLLHRGLSTGLVHRSVELADVMRTFPMAYGAVSDDVIAGRESSSERVRTLLHRALFTTEFSA